MNGRCACLLFSVFFLPGAAQIFGQDARLARIAPQVPVDPPSARFPVRIVRPPRLPVAPPVVIGFPQFARAAGMIFSGTVTKIERRPASRGNRSRAIERGLCRTGRGGCVSDGRDRGVYR
jgi:hypothetical protein